MGVFQMLARRSSPCACSHSSATVVCKPRPTWRITPSPGYEPPACKETFPAFSKLFDSLCHGLWAWGVHTRAGKGDEQASGSAWGWNWWTHTVRWSSNIWHTLPSDRRHPLIPLGSAWLVKLPGRVLLGSQFASSETGRTEHPKAWMDLQCFSKQKQQGAAPGAMEQWKK